MHDYLANIEGLLPYQVEPTERLLRVVRQQRRALDASDCGVGKTFQACAVIRELDLPCAVVCPKISMTKWERAAIKMGTEVSPINYEMLVTGRTPFGTWWSDRGVERFRWHPAVKMVVFDEAHRCVGLKTKASKAMIAARQQDLHGIALSATIAETPIRMKATAYFLGLFHGGYIEEVVRTPRGLETRRRESAAVSGPFHRWASGFGCREGWKGWDFYGDERDMARLHDILFPRHGIRVRIQDLGDQFPDSQVTSELVDFGHLASMSRHYAAIERHLAEVRARWGEVRDTGPAIESIRDREEIEILKVPVLADMTRDLIEQGRSVSVFVNFRSSHGALAELLADLDPAIVIGQQDRAERDAHLDRYQEDKTRAAVLTVDAGAESIDLHDVRGQFPRVGLVCPPWSAWKLRQAVARLRRAGGRSKSLVRILSAAGTIEERVDKVLNQKNMNLDAINDGDPIPA